MDRLSQRCGDPELPTPDVGSKWCCFSGLGAFATRSLLTARAAVFATVAAATCAPEPPIRPFLDLVPVAVSTVPEVGTHIALASEATACTNLLYHTRVYCVGRTGRVVGDFGREGDGPGEFDSVTDLARGPDGTIGVFDWGLSRMTVFMPDGTMVSETKMPGLITPARSFQSTVSGSLATVDLAERRGSTELGYKGLTLLEVDAQTGEVLWMREELEYLDEDGCYPIAGTPGANGRWAFKGCNGDLYFLDHRDAKNGRLVESPTYVPEFPNDRDVAEYLEEMRFAGPLPPELLKSYEEEYRAEPKIAFLGTRTLVFEGNDRLWYATTRDRDDFSYLDVWVGTTYVGTVRIRDRLMAYDILGSTLVAFVERGPDRDGIAAAAIDWYDIGDLEFPVSASH